MDVRELMAEIESLNSMVEHYNSLRSKNMGKKETLEHQCEALFKSYEETYGVKLTPETLDAEFEKVVAEKSHETKLLSDVLSAIKAGQYDHANALMGVKADEQPVYDTNDFSKRKNEIQHSKFEVTGASPVVTTEMERKEVAVSSAKTVVESPSGATGADFEKKNDVTAPVEVAMPKSIPAPVEDDEFVPKMTMPQNKASHPKPTFKVPTDDFEEVVPTKGMTKSEAPMDALEGFTAPKQAAPVPNMFDTAPKAPTAPKKSQALSFEDMFGSAFRK